VFLKCYKAASMSLKCLMILCIVSDFSHNFSKNGCVHQMTEWSKNSTPMGPSAELASNPESNRSRIPWFIFSLDGGDRNSAWNIAVKNLKRWTGPKITVIFWYTVVRCIQNYYSFSSPEFLLPKTDYRFSLFFKLFWDQSLLFSFEVRNPAVGDRIPPWPL
jgi:hypothetical protein